MLNKDDESLQRLFDEDTPEGRDFRALSIEITRSVIRSGLKSGGLALSELSEDERRTKVCEYSEEALKKE